jgi:uncharacterized protein with von Willebrand factor type A (vWA) domain
MDLLNLKPSAPAQGRDGLDVTEAEGVPSTSGVGTHPTALKLDAWDLAQGERLAKVTGTGEESHSVLADFHGAAFLPDPELVEGGCSNRRQGEFVQTLLETPEYRELHEATQLNPLASEMAVVQFSREYFALEKREEEKERKRGNRPPSEKEQQKSLMATHRAVGKAIRQASEEVDELDGDMAALGCGKGQGGDGRMDTATMASVFQRIKNNRQLRRICELAGRFRRVAQSKQRSKATHGYDDMVGVVMDGDVARLLPHELALLADEETELDAMRRLVERQSMCRQFKGVEKVGKGPIVVCVDESGSMSGEPVCQAKALALALAWVARHQKRYCVLVGYSGGTEGTSCVLPPGKWDETKLMDWLSHFYSGGTDMDVPLVEVPKMWESLGVPKGKTDIILLTDAIVRVPDEMAKAFLAWKAQEKVKCISLILAARAGDLGKVSDQVHLIRRVDVDQAGIQETLAI